MADLTGVYAIFRKGTPDCYIGSSIKISRRWSEHKGMLRKGTHYNSKLQRAWNKYGEGAFTFIILELCPVKGILKAEERWLQAFYPKYNISYTPTDGWSEAVRIHLAELSKGKPKNPELIARMTETVRAKHRIIPAFGRLWAVQELANYYKIPRRTLGYRLKAGVPPEECGASLRKTKNE